MNYRRHTVKTTSNSTLGAFVMLAGLLGANGSGASSSGRFGGRALSPRLIGLALILAVSLMAVVASPAFAKESHVFDPPVFGSPGSGPGQLALAAHSGLAVNQATGDLYVADTGNGRIQRFEADGTFVGAFGSFTTPTFIAIDNSPGGEGDVYVVDTATNTVSKFEADGTPVAAWGTSGQLTEGGGHAFEHIVGVAVGPAGNLFVLNANGATNQLTRFEPDSTFIDELTLGDRGTEPYGIAVDPAGNIFKVNGDSSVQEFGPGGANIGTVTDESIKRFRTTALNIDPSSGDLYVATAVDEANHPRPAVDHYAFNASGDVIEPEGGTCVVAEQVGCQPTDTFGSQAPSEGELETPAGLAVGPSSTVYVGDAAKQKLERYVAAILPDSTTKAATQITRQGATLNGTVGAAGGPDATCTFQYTTASEYSQHGFGGAAEKPCSPPGPFTGSSSKSVSAALAGLNAETTYNFRLLAESEKGQNPGKTLSFTTRPAVTLTTGSASAITRHSATLNGEINPEDELLEECRFEYGETTAYGNSVPCAESLGAIGSGNSPVPVHAAVAGLDLSTRYHFRLAAKNSFGETHGADSSFATVGPAEVLATFTTKAAADSVTLGAQIRLHGVPTTYRFEWGPTTSYGNSVPVPDGSLGSGEDEAEPSQRLQALQPDTTYHFRVFTRAEVEHEVFEEAIGPDTTFTTQPAAATPLLDARQYQLVSPPDKLGAVIRAPADGLAQAAADGSAVSYLANAPTELSAPGSTAFVQILSARGPGGWSTRDIPSPHTRRATSTTFPEYTLFSEQLSAGLVQPWGLFEPSLSPDATEQTPFIRTLAGCAADCYRPLVTAANALPGFGEEALCEEGKGTKTGFLETQCGPAFLGATPDLSHVVLLSPQPLSAGAGHSQLYEWSDGALRQVSLLPKNEAGEELPAPEGTGEGKFIYPAAKFGVEIGSSGPAEAVGSVRHAISADGRRVFWEVGGLSVAATEEALYVRDTELGETLQLDTAEAACLETGPCESGGGRFQFASADGSRVFFTDTHPLTADSGAVAENLKADLYECAVEVDGEGHLACSLTDLTPASGGEPANVLGSLLGASADGEYLYFLANGVLAHNVVDHGAEPEEAHPAKCEPRGGFSTQTCNLYLLHQGQISFVAALSGADYHDWDPYEDRQSARVSPNGRFLSFMSERSLTGYDNRDAVSGRPDAELYEYDAQTAGLVCASCNPSGARPQGTIEGPLGNGLLGNGALVWDSSSWVAALPPGRSTFAPDSSAYQPRWLSDSGRLFFNAVDALAPQDQNQQLDVYEYEPVGVGDCQANSPGYQPAAGSCLGLLTSGASGSQSIFLDASESGADVFFLTSSRLDPLRDLDSAIDVYDAHECLAAAATCFPAPEPPPPACAGDACQQPATPPNDSTPGSLTFQGAGNVVECPKGKIKKSGKCVAKKSKKHRKSHKRGKKNKRTAIHNRGGQK